MDPVFTYTARLLLTIILVAGAVKKLSDMPAFQNALLEMVPLHSIRGLLSYLVPFTELAIAIAMIVPGLSLLGAWAGLALIALYTAVLSISFLQGKSGFDCGCSFGTEMEAHPKILVRNGILLAVAIVGIWPATGRAVTGPDSANILAATLVLITLYTAVEALIALPIQSNRRHVS